MCEKADIPKTIEECNPTDDLNVVEYEGRLFRILPDHEREIGYRLIPKQ